jgi:hypothetical protein
METECDENYTAVLDFLGTHTENKTLNIDNHWGIKKF